MKGRHGSLAQRVRDALLNRRGDTLPELREVVLARAEPGGDTRSHDSRSRDEQPGVPPELASYIDTVARNAYKVTDEQVAELRRLGLSEDAVFEITACAALGAGLGRLAIGMNLLEEHRATREG